MRRHTTNEDDASRFQREIATCCVAVARRRDGGHRLMLVHDGHAARRLIDPTESLLFVMPLMVKGFGLN